MSKRSADKELTDRNWDDEEEAEEAGHWKPVSSNGLARRAIKTATRRLRQHGAAASSANASGSPFSGFAGFTHKSTAPSFQFNNQVTVSGQSSSVPVQDGFKLGAIPQSTFSLTTTTTSSPASFKFTVSASSSQFGKGSADNTDDRKDVSEVNKARGKSSSTALKETSSRDPAYFVALKALNRSVLQWIKQHVDSNPYVILSPVFKDYESHYNRLAAKYPPGFFQEPDNLKKPDSKLDSDTVLPMASSVSIPVNESGSSGFTFNKTAPTTKTTFRFGSAAEGSDSHVKDDAAKPAFKFGKSTTVNFAGFAAAAQSKSQKQNVINFPVAATSQSKGDEEEEYVPPKAEHTEIEEEGAFYTKRCKLFYKKGEEYIDRGIGNLHLKPSGDKTQLVIRADTALGNILLNIILSSNMPTSRIGKNNVALVCVPNPPVDAKMDPAQTVMMLIRVKTSDDADDLLAQLEKCKT